MTKKSLNDFKLVLSGIMDNAANESANILHAAWIETPLGPMLAIANEKSLFLLEFADWHGLTKEIHCLRKETHSVILPGKSAALTSIRNELEHYFSGKLKNFKTPLRKVGTDFQNQVWTVTKKIPYGQTRSYYDIAMLLGKPSAFRAVANANSKNKFAIVIPCHRVINHNGGIGGYGGGIPRKKWLIEHELS
ncbi:methylated-DNA--[protein]-cysteine S-methyltransferase [Candidatus Berkiella aquae]|uniref:methylated-DNA--[protein]-cysteine S-methyltransferase n=1 Tax=Candidatus Berkiella aquae TaxID=295108 RepID=A0A0Q9YMF1_9GAMM|nr:methylated-DNA--[protein]-cysteine S-methyltransferase [Candidatus Berkiella aquae]MCS5710376.1 methylated-DNA--[protein]-cysteine S-methyltransferase [Candidatus Berkiella aquae]